MSHPGNRRRSAHPRSGHSHHLSEIPAVLSPFAKWFVIVSLAIIGVGVVVGTVVLWPSGDGEHAIPLQFRAADGGPIETVDGHVVSQTRAACLNPLAGTVQDSPVFQIEGASGPCILSTVQLDSGPDTGRHTLLEVPTNAAQSGSEPGAVMSTEAPDQPQAGQPTLEIGDKIRLTTLPGPYGNSRYTFFDFQRGVPTLVWALLFVGAVVMVAAWRGLRSIIGLAFAFLVLGVFTLPAILNGEPPVAVAVVSSAAILFVVLYLAHGVSLRTSSALLGTLTSLVLAGVLSWLAINTMHLTGLSGDQTTNLQVYSGTISVDGLLLAGFIIGTLGVLNDVTITQASAAFELAAAGEPTRLATFRAAMRVGRDHIASTVYTLVFAYAGSALPLLLLFSVAQQPFASLLTTDALAVELARSFVGGIAIALSVPLTTVIAAALAQPAGAEVPTQPQVEPAHGSTSPTPTARHARSDD
ncbi:YibE/F family protein [Gordonia rhizosphera]|uniref:YibE/F family protein n=1 Tax=Gordonia rhizosphera NBRC 16068 TaxID=1108045 RepID=K6WP73_9ACTN|nr:YibE/F family protein [Gordonia rhizosphera]GAB93927.1 hypothetical protein GORHZ_247_00650 [Gordonia rhizosphera NBRC 16068]